MGKPRTTDPASPQADWWWIFDPRISLRASAALIFGGSVVIFTVLFSWLAGTLFHRALERQIGGTFETLAFQVNDKLDRALYERHRELQLTADLAPFRALDFPPAERRKMLETLQTAALDFAWIGFADATGRVTAATRGIFEGSQVDTRPWFRAGRERAFVGGLNEFPALARALANSDDDRSARYLDLAVPVLGANGQFLGVLGAHLHWEWAREVQQSVVPENARRERIGVTVYGTNGDVLHDSGGSGWTLPPEAPVITDSRRFRGSLLENASGGPYLTGFSRSRGYRNHRAPGWLITVRQPVSLALAPARELQKTIAGSGFLFAAFLVLVSWVAAGRLTRRFRSIRAAADRIREGDVLTVMPPQHGEGEIAQMCGALGRMVDDLREKQETLTAENARLAAEARRKSSSDR